MLTGLHHISVAVQDIETCAAQYENVLGAKRDLEGVSPDGQYKICFMTVGDLTIELIQPLHPSDILYEQVTTRGGFIHHIALVTDNIEQEMASQREKGARFLDENPVRRILSQHGWRAYLHPKTLGGTIIELIQTE